MDVTWNSVQSKWCDVFRPLPGGYNWLSTSCQSLIWIVLLKKVLRRGQTFWRWDELMDDSKTYRGRTVDLSVPIINVRQQEINIKSPTLETQLYILSYFLTAHPRISGWCCEAALLFVFEDIMKVGSPDAFHSHEVLRNLGCTPMTLV